MHRVLVTGAAGFIGFHASVQLLDAGFQVVGMDNLNDYYDTALKQARLDRLRAYASFEFHKVDIADQTAVNDALQKQDITHILHLAAQAGVRYSLENPSAYVQSNLVGHLNILEYARHSDTVEHVVYASSSSVYGDREGGPFSEGDIVRRPASLYAATKIGGEMMAESYHSLYKIPQTGLRFFTVYGPWGRPDMAYFIFTDKIFKGDPITLFAPDEMYRDFTYVDDIVEVLPTILQNPPKRGHEIYNLGNSSPNSLKQLVDCVEKSCGMKAEKIIAPKQNGDVSRTFADVRAAQKCFGFNPSTDLESGILKFAEWYKGYYKPL